MDFGQFVKKASEVHGGRYRYSDDGFGPSVLVTCTKHGEFRQSIYDHLHGHGCPECGKERYKEVNSRRARAEFVEKASKVHGGRYGYEKVEYVNNKSPVTITCPEHGDFKQSPGNHLHGAGCPKCARNQKLTQEEFLERVRAVHGDRYDYSKIVYRNGREKVEVVCPVHGSFMIGAEQFSKGDGCPKCSREAFLSSLEEERHKNGEEFLKNAGKVHGNRYDYSKSKYVNGKTPIYIVCPEHGEFWQSPGSHLSGHGCPKCGIARIKASLLSNTEEFVKKARAVHGDRYDYSKVEYEAALKKVAITCPEHGEFLMAPHDHLKGCGCPKCAMISIAKKQLDLHGKSTESFIEEARKVHGDDYDYSESVYVNAHTKVKIRCRRCGAAFEQMPGKHVGIGQWCPNCRSSHYERMIRDSLERKGIRYEREKTFPGLVSDLGVPLRFDFYLPESNTCIEYDGTQHGRHVEWMMTGEEFRRLRERDRRKDEYCREHGIRLIRISGGEEGRFVTKEVR